MPGNLRSLFLSWLLHFWKWKMSCFYNIFLDTDLSFYFIVGYYQFFLQTIIHSFCVQTMYWNSISVTSCVNINYLLLFLYRLTLFTENNVQIASIIVCACGWQLRFASINFPKTTMNQAILYQILKNTLSWTYLDLFP